MVVTGKAKDLKVVVAVVATLKHGEPVMHLQDALAC